MFEVIGGARRMGPRMLADLLAAFAELVAEAPEAAVFTARKLAAVFTREGDREDEELREAKAEALRMFREAGPAAAAKVAC